MNGTIPDLLLLVVLPYVAVTIFFIGTIRRYRTVPFSYSSLSTQFLENKQHFWGLVPFHYGLIVILFGHLIGFAIPRSVLWWNSVPARLYILEISALIFGLLTLIGLIQIVYRRLSTGRVLVITTKMDWVLYGLLLVQIVLGLYTAVAYPWGSSWFATLAAPYLWSLCKFSPDVSFVAPLPWMFKAHIVGAYALLAIFPFTRLVHLLVYPLPYVWRKPQVVRWYSRPEGNR